MPVGLCKMRTAVSTLFTFCPPLPPLRKVSISRSAGLISIGAVSAISGTTSTLANDVCRRLFASNGEIRTRRWTLRSVRFVLLFRRELMERIEILDLAFQFVKRIDQRAQTRDFIDIGLGALAIVPKIGGGHPRFERGQFFLEFGQVKETSAARARE